MMDITSILTLLSTWMFIAAGMYVLYLVIIRGIGKIFETKINEAIIRLDDRAKINNALRNLK